VSPTPAGPTTPVAMQLRRRLAVGLIAGLLAGLAVGVIISALVLDGWGRASIGIIVAATIACTLLALLWSGYASLGSPDPGEEASGAGAPLDRDQPLVTEERGDPLKDVPGHGLDHDGSG
jgi:predicted lipid-binding transport protein (Tim44 family)